MEESNDLPVWIELLLVVSVGAAILGFIVLPEKIARFFRKESPQPPKLTNATGTVEPRSAILMLGILTVAICGFVEILSIVVRNGTDTWFTHLGFSIMGGVGVYLIVGYFRSCFAYNERGASSTTTTGFKGTVTWIELRNVGFSRFMNRLTFETRTGDKIRITTNTEWSNGIQDMAAMVLENVSPNVIDEKTRTAITHLAAGKSPTAGKHLGERPPLTRFVVYLLNQLRKVIAYRRGR